MVAALFVAETIPHFSAILALVGGSIITRLAFVLPSFSTSGCATENPKTGRYGSPCKERRAR